MSNLVYRLGFMHYVDSKIQALSSDLSLPGF